MIILTVTNKGTIHLPAETLANLKGRRHLKLRQNATCITLTPVSISAEAERYAIPEVPAGKGDTSYHTPTRQI